MNNVNGNCSLLNEKEQTTVLFMQFVEKCIKTEENIEKIWKQLAVGEFETGMSNVITIFSQLEALLKDIEIINKFKIIELSTVDIFKFFARLESAMKISDYILVGDIIKYEIKHEIIEWKKIINKIINK